MKITLIIFLTFLATNLTFAEQSKLKKDLTMGPNSADELVNQIQGALDGQVSAPIILSPDSAPEDPLHPDDRTMGQTLFHEARLAVTQNKFAEAEKLFLKSLQYKLTVDERKNLLLELALMYDRVDNPAKMAMIYERYLKQYPEDPSKPQILIYLGRIYRDMGAYHHAIDKFYGVLNMSFDFNSDQLPFYRYLTTKAQLEIADTYFILKDYEKASKLFIRLKLLNISSKEAERVHFKYAYSQFQLKNYVKAIEEFNSFIYKYPNSSMTPESHFVLAFAYKKVNRTDMAIAEVLKLLQKEINSATPHETTWKFWRKKTSNHLANDFYEQGDYISALKIYQAMTPLGDTPEWQWPIIYQIGRCFERLNMLDKAKEAYHLIVSGEQWKDIEFEVTAPLATIKDTAEWRLGHVTWLQNTQIKVSELLNAPSAPAPAKKTTT